MPFPKSLGVKAGGYRVLAARYPELATGPHGRIDGHSVWYLPPPEGSWPRGPIPVRYVVLPRYVPGARTALTSISKSSALEGMLAQSSQVRAHGALGLRSVVKVVRGADCYTLTVGDLREAVHALQRMVSSRSP